MNVLKWSFNDRILRSPDEPAAPEPAAIDPALTAEPAAAADSPAEPATEPVVAEELAPAAPKPPAMVPLRVLQERVGEETSKRQAAEERERIANERATALEEITRRLQAKEAPDPAAVARTQPAPSLDQNAIDQAATQQLFQRDLAAVSETGFSTYGQQWSDAIAALNTYGANSAEFVANVMDVDKAKTHEIMFQIAQDPEKAVQLAKMTPTRRIAELTRMTMAQSAAADPKPAAEVKPAAQISRAPAPKPNIAPLAPAPEVDPTTPDGNDKMDDKAWEAWYKTKYMKRA